MGLSMVVEARVSRIGEVVGDDEMHKLQGEVDELRKLVHTLLTIIMEEADGVQTGAAPSIPNQPKRGFVM